MHLSMMVETAKPVIYSGLLYTDKTHRGKKERKSFSFATAINTVFTDEGHATCTERSAKGTKKDRFPGLTAGRWSTEIKNQGPHLQSREESFNLW